jgi:hypothetical protein
LFTLNSFHLKNLRTVHKIKIERNIFKVANTVRPNQDEVEKGVGGGGDIWGKGDNISQAYK